MSKAPKGFEGLVDPSSPSRQVNLIDAERLNLRFKRNQKKARLREWEKTECLKRQTACILLYGCLALLGILISIGAVFGDFEAAKLWWLFAGPLVGYVLRILYERKVLPP